ncbi:hypothetical protein B0187_09470 [Haemophilus paracuniculus]|uniref:Uncharacterized protein n=1 Tax=Haemophilus paracuniculus TaxID=734 RepID=A0A1T0AQ01_9PAST|nr:hypothetical protein [Haemophilus paracuniculus]OOR98160.1 hypothetical protein B0187_09470 [Haemophilus paracuniculus]
MKWFKLGFVLFGLMMGNVANANDTFAPPVKLTPKLEKHFLKVESKIVDNNRRMLTNVNRVKAGEANFFDKEMMKSLRYLTQEVRKIEKGNYNKALLRTTKNTGYELIRNAKTFQVALDSRRNQFTLEQYNAIKYNIERMDGFGGAIYNTSLRTGRKYYPND